ncbi:MAG TPA: FG-GAP-like repeat-containing protein [Terriglobia bacterium]
MGKAFVYGFFCCLAVILGGVEVEAQNPLQKVYGIDFSPYLNGQDPNIGSQITPEQIAARLQIIAPYTTWVRSFGSTNGLENIPLVAHQMGLKVAANAWISNPTLSPNDAQNTAEINSLVAAANAGLVDIAIVGSEAIRRKDVTVSQLLAYMQQVRAAIPQNIPVTTADIWQTFIDNPSLIAASDVVFANLYPYWESTPQDNALCSLESSYQKLQTAAGATPVYVSETGWPSAGGVKGFAVPSVANANLYALQFLSWANANGIKSFYFEAFDEAWKANTDEGTVGAHWGLWDVNGAMKSGMNAFFNGQTAPVDCTGDGFISGPTALTFTYVPPYGSADPLDVKVTGIHPADYVLATYIQVFGGWWTKPTFDQPTVPINPDGTVQVAIDTGGSDQLATDIAVFLIPAGCTPPKVGNGALPTLDCAVASLQVHRTQSSISGTITDNLNVPIANAAVSDPVLGTTTTAPDGRYSFYQITAAGTATLTVTYPIYTFAASPKTVPIPMANLIVNFTGLPTLTITSAALPDGYTGAPYAATLVATGGGTLYSNWAIGAGALPPGLVLDGASGIVAGTPTTTSGSPYGFSVTVQDNLGNMAAPQTFTITVATGMTTSTVLTSSANPQSLGQPVTLTATITPAPTTGKVTFYDSTTLLGISSISNGIATLHTSMLASGARSLKAYYGGGAAYRPSMSATVKETVRAVPTNGFHAGATLMFGATANSVVIGDFNSDGKADLAVTNDVFAGTISVFLGKGDGTFQTAAHFGAGINPMSPVVADFNGDGKTDLAVLANFIPSRTTVGVFLGNGDGTFQPAMSFGADIGSNAIAAADLNGDGNADIVVANATSNDVSVLLGNGDGTFQSAVNFGVGSYPLSVSVGDFNDDGRADIVSANSGLFGGGHDVSVLLGNGDGTFQSAVDFGVGPYPYFVVVGDFNGDGEVDLAVANYATYCCSTIPSVSVLLGNGNGTFQTALSFAAGSQPFSLAVGDFNGDGAADLAVVNDSTDYVILLLGNGDGTLQAPVNLSPGSSSLRSIAVGDLNSDGATDIITATGAVFLGSLLPRQRPRGQLTSQ